MNETFIKAAQTIKENCHIIRLNATCSMCPFFKPDRQVCILRTSMPEQWNIKEVIASLLSDEERDLLRLVDRNSYPYLFVLGDILCISQAPLKRVPQTGSGYIDGDFKKLLHLNIVPMFKWMEKDISYLISDLLDGDDDE